MRDVNEKICDVSKLCLQLFKVSDPNNIDKACDVANDYEAIIDFVTDKVQVILVLMNSSQDSSTIELSVTND